MFSQPVLLGSEEKKENYISSLITPQNSCFCNELQNHSKKITAVLEAVTE